MNNQKNDAAAGSDAVDQLTIDYAKSFIGTPYRWGGASPGGIDCSGLVIEILISCGVLPHKYDTTAQGLFNGFSKEWPTLIYPATGALVFYGRSLANITHIGYCLDGYRCLEAGGGESSVHTAEEAWKKAAFVRVRPVLYRKDLLTYLMPRYPLAKNLPVG